MKKILAFLLVVAQLISIVPIAYATNTQNYSQGTQVVFEATGTENYTITVPAKLAPQEEGVVLLQGTWPDNKTVKVTADQTVTLTNNLNQIETKIIDVYFDGISAPGNNKQSVSATQNICVGKVNDALFGKWTGTFYYNVEMIHEAQHVPYTIKFYQPYEFVFSESDRVEIVFHKDGALDLYYYEADAEYGEIFDVGTAIYEQGKVSFLDTTYTISEDGTCLSPEPANGTPNGYLIPTPIKSLKMGTSYSMLWSDEYGTTDYHIIFAPDGSYQWTEFYDGQLGYQDNIPAGRLTYYDEYFTARFYDEETQETLFERSAIYPDATKIILGNDIFHLNCPHDETEVRNQSATYSGDTYCKDCDALLQEGDYIGNFQPGLYQPGTIALYLQDNNIDLENRRLATWKELTSSKVLQINNERVLHAHKEPVVTSLDEDLEILGSTACGIYGDLILPEGISGIEAFARCETLTGVYMPNTVKEIDKNAFQDCIALNTVRLSENITSIPDYSFSDAKSLQQINIPSGVEHIGYWAFADSGLSHIELPDTVREIEEDAFVYCDLMTISAKDNPKYHATQGVLIETASKTIVLASNTAVIPSDPAIVTAIGTGAFKGRTLTHISIPNNIQSIGDDAFAYTSELTSITLPETLKRIGSWAFAYSGLESITLPLGLTEIGAGFCGNCYNLQTVHLPADLTYIPSDAFENCRSLETIVLPNSLKVIKEYAFHDSRLETITIPSSVTQIEERAFAYCASLTQVNFEDSTNWSVSTDNINYSPVSQEIIGDPAAMAQRLRNYQNRESWCKN